jgi:hypothetical protein
MAKRPTKPAPQRDTIASLRGKLIDEQNLTAHLLRQEVEIKVQAQRLQRQSGAAARILRTLGCIEPRHGRIITTAIAEILAANAEARPFSFDEDVPF